MKVRRPHDCLPLSKSSAALLGPVLRRVWNLRLGLLAVLLSKSASFAAGPEIAIEQSPGTPLGGVIVWGNNSFGQADVPAAARSGVQAIAAGDSHTVALKNDGTVMAWGRSGEGQTDVPAGLADVQSIAAGWNHTVVLKRDGTIAAWGNNSAGQLTVPAAARSGVQAIAAGYNRTVALKRDGTVIAWGNDENGQTTVPRGLSGVRAIAAGDAHTVALQSDGTVVAWGWNIHGQTTAPAGLTGVQALAAGNFHTVALKDDGSLVAWGRSFDGQTDVPVRLSGVQAIAAGGYHTVALKNDGTVAAWGRNFDGQTDVPAGLTGIVRIAAGFAHTVALQNSTVIFADQNLSTTSAAKTFTIKNTGDAALHLSSVSVVGGNADDFSVSTTTTLGEIPASTGITTFTVAFIPTAPGLRTATLRVLSDSADESAFDIALSGTATGTLTTRPASAADDTALTTGKQPVDIDVLANDPGADRTRAVITFSTLPQHGTVSIVGGKVRYIPSGALPLAGDIFTYHYDDGHGGTGTGTVPIGNIAALAGDYDGLIEADPAGTGAERHRQSGHLRVSLSKTGVFTGALTFGGTRVSPGRQPDARRFAFMDRLDSAGNSTRTLQHRTSQHRSIDSLISPPITLALHFDAATGTITGTATSSESSTPFTSELTLARRTAVRSLAGKYALQMEPDPSPGTPDGIGAARVKIARNGRVITVGRLADGAVFSSSTLLHAGQTFPLYAVLYRGNVETRGSLRGTVQLPGETAVASELEWFKPARPRDRFFPEGFAVSPSAQFVD